MFKLFKKKPEIGLSQKQQELIHDLAKKEKVINTLIKKGLLSFNPVTHRLFISTTLAQLYLTDSERWTAFLRNIHNWAIYHRQQEAWNDYFLKVETSAVREAKKKYAALSKADIARIRQQARIAVDITAIPAPKVQPFEYFIADIEAKLNNDVLVVGNFDGENFEMENYERVQRFIKK